MAVDVARIIATLLVPTGAIGALVACTCPEPISPEADETVRSSAALAATLQADLEQQQADGCDERCDELVGEAAGVWGCAYEPNRALDPTHVTCSSDGPDPRSERVDLAGGGSLPTSSTTDTSDTATTTATTTPSTTGTGATLSGYVPLHDTCRAICSQTGGWQIAIDEGYSDAAVPVGCEVMGESTDEASVFCSYDVQCLGGRRPLTPVDSVAGPGVGAWWAAMARLEAASVPAFLELARDLEVHGAPAALVARARQAAADERRHTELCLAQARAHGAEIELKAVPLSEAPTDWATLVRHNAVEGCTRETYAALEAGWQAQHAGDPTARVVLAEIHGDEVRHAQLAWDVHAWARQRQDTAVDAEAINAMDAYLVDAFAALTEAVQTPADPQLTWAVGLPDAATRRGLTHSLQAALLAG